MIINYFSW